MNDYIVIAAKLFTYAIFLHRFEQPLEEYLRVPLISALLKLLEEAIPACPVHRSRGVVIWCRTCSKEACTVCWK